MDTREFLKRYAYLYCYVAAFFLCCAALFLRGVEAVSSMQPFSSEPVIIIDAGHGGLDGGTTGVTGVKEDQVNLEIARRLEALLGLMGMQTKMTRTGDADCSTEGDTIRARKQSDLKNRVALINDLPSAVLVSIHQNHFPDGRYHGPQVFYAGEGEGLARELQSSLNTVLYPTSTRTAKRSAGVYLMEHVTQPAVLIECGFLSNAEEEQNLSSAGYQKQLAALLAAVLARYVNQTIS